MTKAGIPILFLCSMFLVALPINLPLMPLPRQAPSPPPPPPSPLCASQLALASYACAMVPLVPLPPPPSPTTPELGHGNGHRHHGQRHNRHRHRHSHGRNETREQGYCCRWLRLVQTECVCNILVHLPFFLSRPFHDYTVSVDESCSFTYSCGRRLRP